MRGGRGRWLGAWLVERPLGAPAALEPRPDSLAALVGTYRVDPHTSYTVTGADGRLFVRLTGMDAMEMVPVAPLDFVARNVTWTFRFETDGSGRSVSLRVRDWSLDDRAERAPEKPSGRLAEVSIEPTLLDGCVGAYELITGVIITVRREDGRLVVQATGQSSQQVRPSSPTEFFADDAGPTYTFLRDSSGKVTGLVQHQGGWDLPARRLR